MTKKEEISLFVNQYVNDEVSIQFETNMIDFGERCLMFVSASKEQIITILQDYFSDDLIGHMPNDGTQHHIIS